MINEVRWDITGTCNLNCGHCQAAKYYQKEKEKGKRDLSFKDIKIVVDRLAKSGVKRIGILGGEPLTRPDIIDIMKYITESGIDVSLNTNLTLLQKFDIDELWRYCKAVYVSLDGVCAEEHDRLRGKGTFDITCENIRKLAARRHEKDINLSMVLNLYNYRSSSKIYDFIKQMDIETCFIDVVRRVGNADDNWDKLGLSMEQEIEAVVGIVNSWDFDSEIMLNLRMYTNKFRDYLYKKTGVRLNDKLVWDAPGKTSLYILNDGTLLPAHFLAYMNLGENFNSKSLVNFDIDEIVTSDSFKDFLSLYDAKLPHTYYKTCQNCSYCGKQCNPSPVSYWIGKEIPMDFCVL